MSLHIDDLPKELIIEVLTCADWRSLIRCSAVCQTWRQLVDEAARLQYLIELGANDLVDNTSSTELSSSAKLELLHERKAAWRKLKWRETVGIRTPGDCNAYEFVSGVFAKAANVDRHPLGWRRLSLYTLPSRRGPGSIKIINDVGMFCRDFAMDPTQDLIAYVEIARSETEAMVLHVHLRTLSTNQSHPVASVPILCYCLPLVDPIHGSTTIQICDDVLALLFRLGGIPWLMIWHWKEGRLLVEQVNAADQRFVDDFSLLSNRAFMLVSRFPHAGIQLWRFCSFGTGNDRQAELIVTLRLPELRVPTHSMIVTSHTSPFTASIPSGHPFATSEDARVHVMYIRISTFEQIDNPLVHGDVGNYVMIVRNEVFLSYLSRFGDVAINSKLHAMFPWEIWGPDNTRWLNESLAVSWLRYVHGSRFLRCIRVMTPHGPRNLLRIQEFFMHPGRPDEFHTEGERTLTSQHRLVNTPTIIQNSNIFIGNIESRLPYYEAISLEVFPHTAFMIDDERIIGLKTSGFAHISADPSEIDVFLM